MKSLFEKFSDLGLGGLHALLDELSNSSAMSVPVAKQGLRRLSDRRDRVDEMVNEAQGKVNVLHQDQAAAEARIAQLESTMKAILTDDDPTNDAAAAPLMEEKLGVDKKLATIKADLDLNAETLGALTQALAMIDSRVKALTARIQEIESDNHVAEAQNTARSALAEARKQIGDDDGPDSLDSTANAARQRRATATAGLQRETERMKDAVKAPVVNAEVSAALAQFKAGLKNDKAA